MASIGGLQGSIMGTAQTVAVNPDKVKKDLLAAAQKGGTSGRQAQQLLDALNADPNLLNDPNFTSAVDKVQAETFLTHSGGWAGVNISNPQGADVDNLARQVSGISAGQSDAKQNDAIQQIIANARKQQESNQQFVDQSVTPYLGAQALSAGAAQQADQAALAAQTASRNTAASRMNGAVDTQRALAGNYNTQSQNAFNSYQSQQNALNAQDQGSLSRYMSETDPLMTRMQARGSDPADVQRQLDSYNQLSGVGSGSLDYQAAQAALTRAGYTTADQTLADYRQYASDPADIRRQETAYNDFRKIGNGSLDWQSQAAKAYADPTDVANQRKALTDIQNDVAHGDARQQESYDLMKSRTGVEQTAQERALYELNRRQAEAQTKSSRDAVMSNLAARGILSGGAQIASMQQQSQQIAQDRQIADMLANAGAVQRSTQYTGMMADQGNAMRNSLQNALGLQGNLSTAMRNASFDEAYKRGVGADNASAANQATRMQGYTNAGQQSNAIRDANDRVGMFNTDAYNQNSMFNAGQANQISMFNADAYNSNQQFNAGEANTQARFNAGETNQARANNQSTRLAGIQGAATQSNNIRSANDSIRMFQDSYAQQEATRVGNLAGARASTSLGATSQIGSRNAQTYGDQQAMLNTNYGRDKDTNALDYQTAGNIYGMDTDVNRLTQEAGANMFNRATTQAGTAMGVAGTRAAQQGSDAERLRQALMLGVGQEDYTRAARTLGGY